MRRFAPALLLALLASGCGRDEEAGPVPSPWSSCRVEGILDASDLCAVGAELLAVSGGGSREVYAIARKELVPGGRAFARTVPVQPLGDPFLSGSDELAAQSYRFSDLWSQDVDFQGIAYLAPDRVYLGERRYRVVYEGFLERDAMGRAQRVVLQRVFAVPGASRPGRATSDWRDASPGLAGIAARTPEDLVVVERASAAPREFRAFGLDRKGPGLERSTMVLPDGATADVGGLAWSGERGVVVNGGGPGALVSIPHGSSGARVPVGPGEQGPTVADAGPWRGIARTPDGVTWLVSSGPKTQVAWR